MRDIEICKYTCVCIEEFAVDLKVSTMKYLKHGQKIITLA